MINKSYMYLLLLVCVCGIVLLFGYSYVKNPDTRKIVSAIFRGNNKIEEKQVPPTEKEIEQKNQEVVSALEASNASLGLPDSKKLVSEYTEAEKKALEDIEKKNQEILKKLEESMGKKTSE